MDERRLKSLLASVRSGKISLDEALENLRALPYEDLSFAKVDHHRALRQGVPEVIMAQYKTPEETCRIAESMFQRSGQVLITRAQAAHHEGVAGFRGAKIEYNPTARTVVIVRKTARLRLKGKIAVLTAGTSDRAVAEEAVVTARFLGSRTAEVHDVGVAGLHRLVEARQVMEDSRAIIVVAGMEGALPSVVGGLTDKPVVAVPTSVGYGTSLGGLTALLAMLNSCVPGLAVMNIDNGFGAACLAHRINSIRSR